MNCRTFWRLISTTNGVCLGRKDYKNKGVWKTEVHDYNSEQCVREEGNGGCAMGLVVCPVTFLIKY